MDIISDDNPKNYLNPTKTSKILSLELNFST